MRTYYLVASAKESRVEHQVKFKNSNVAWHYYHSYYFLHSWPIVYCQLMSILNTNLLYIFAFFNLIFNFIFKIRVIQWLGLCQKAHVEVRSSCLCIMPLFVVLLEKPVSKSHILFHMQKSCKKIILLEEIFKIITKNYHTHIQLLHATPLLRIPHILDKDIRWRSP